MDGIFGKKKKSALYYVVIDDHVISQYERDHEELQGFSLFNGPCC